MTISTVLLANTFDEWRTVTNQLVTFANDVDADGNLIRFSSNTNALGITANGVRGGIVYISANVATSANDTSTANLVSASLANTLNDSIITNSNRSIGAFTTANAGYTQANTAFEKASAANVTADRAFIQANLAFAKANTANTTADLAYSGISAVSSATSSAFEKTNTAFSQTNTAFARANTANITADAAFGQANLAYNVANTALIASNAAFNASNVAYAAENVSRGWTQAAFGQSNLAFARANTANITADAAFGAANVAYAAENVTRAWAQASFGATNLAFSRANTANITADVAFGQSNLAFARANTAQANGANAILYPINLSSVVDGNVIVFSGTTGRLARDSAKPAPSGSIVGTTDTQRLSNKTMIGVRDVRVALSAGTGTFDIDLSLGNYFTKTVSGTTTFRTINNVATGNASTFVLEMTNAGGYTVTWPSGTKWAGGAAPTFTATGVDVVGFYTHDNGSTWNAILMGLDFK